MKYDAVIIGGGPAGTVAALVLKRLGRHVAVIDRPHPVKKRIGESLPSAARPLMEKLGLMSLLEKGPHAPAYGNVSAWGSSELSATDFIMDPNGVGWHLDRVRFDRDLKKAAMKAGVEWISRGLRKADEAFALADTVIDATGRSAWMARQFGAERQRDDSLMAFYTWLKCEGAREKRTLVESSATGWWYTSALPDRTRVVAFHTDADRVSEIRHSNLGWNQHLNSTVHLRKIIAGAQVLHSIQSAEACGARLDKFAGENWLAVGDAALSFDPLSSQGIFNALYTGLRGAEALDRRLQGDSAAIGEYTSRLESIREAYLAHKKTYYSAEKRWSNQPFWQTRH